MTGGPWGPAPGAFPPPPPPPPKKSNTALIVGLVIAVLAIPTCIGIAIFAVGAFAAKSVASVESVPTTQAPPPGPGPSPQQPTSTNGPVAAPAGFRAVRGLGYSYAVPVAWEELNAATLGSPLITHAQRAPIPTGNFATNVNIAGEPYAGDGPAYGAANLIELRKVSTIRDQRAAVSGSRPAWDIEGYWPNSNGVPYVTLQRYVGNGIKGYVLTCSAGASAYPQQKATCEAVLATFRVD